MQKLNQKGFSAVEGLLIAVIVLLVAGVGYYVYQQSQKQDETNRSQSGVTVQEQAQSESANEDKQASASKYLVIKDWDVKLKLPNKAQDLQYDHNANRAVVFDSNDLYMFSGKSKWCKAEGGKLGTLTRSKTIVKFENQQPEASTKVGDYYYYYSHPQEGCFPSDYNPDGDSRTFESDKQQEAIIKEIADNLEKSLTEN